MSLGEAEFGAILGRIVYFNEIDDHAWEMLTESLARWSRALLWHH